MYAMSIRTEVRCAMKDTILVVHETAPLVSFLGPRRVCSVQEMRILVVVLRL